MEDDVSLLREEVAALRAELATLRRDHQRLLDRLFEDEIEPGQQLPKFMHLETECVAVRDNMMTMPILMRPRENGAFIILQDDQMRTRAELSIDYKTGARFEMRNAAGELIFQVAEAEDGSGQMCVCDVAGQPRTGMRVSEFGGVVNVLDPRGKPLAFLTGHPHGGEIFAVNALQKTAVSIKATERGGLVSVHEPSGQLMGFLSADTETGGVCIYGPLGSVAAGLLATQEGGGAVFHDINGDFVARVPATPEGDAPDED